MSGEEEQPVDLNALLKPLLESKGWNLSEADPSKWVRRKLIGQGYNDKLIHTGTLWITDVVSKSPPSTLNWQSWQNSIVQYPWVAEFINRMKIQSVNEKPRETLNPADPEFFQKLERWLLE